QGILLPKKASSQDLPVLYGAVRPVAGAGKPWGDRAVMEAARVAAALKSHLVKFGITEMTCAEAALVLWSTDAKIIWSGGETGIEKEKEASLPSREQRLVEAFDYMRP